MISSVLKKMENCKVSTSLFLILIFLTLGIGINFTGDVIAELFENAAHQKEDASAGSQTSQVASNDEYLVSYKLTEDDLNELNTVVDENIENLKEMQDVEYENKNEFISALESKITGLTEEYKLLIMKYVEKPRIYKLSEQSFQNLKDKDIPDTILDQLQGLKDKEYESKNILLKEVKAIIRDSADQYPRLIVKEAEVLGTYKLTEQSLKELKEATSLGTIIEKLQEMQDIEYANENLFVNALEETEVPDQYKTLIVEKAAKKHTFDETKLIKWNSDSCGCVFDDLSGIVYGFYPFWMAGEQQQLDFAVLSRIGYYALSFDGYGDIKELMHLEPERAQFINKARKHRTKVDVVIHQNDWQKWPQFPAIRKSYIFNKLKTNIVNLVKVELTDTFSRIKPYISFGTSSIPTIADGVTLYFDGYPGYEDGYTGYEKDKTDVDLFIRFIEELRVELKKACKNYHLNIMLSMDDIKDDNNNGFYDFSIFDRIVPDKGEGKKGYIEQNDVDHFLVFIGEPTKETKKNLRNKVEKLFTGMQRRNMLRKIIPIITPTGNNEQQLIDDIIYFEDNFGGVGLWTVPIIEGSGVGCMTCVKEIFSGHKTQAEKEPELADVVNADLTKYYRKEGAEPISGYKNFVCQHRWGGRILFDLLLAILAFYALLSAFFCRLKGLFVRFFWWFMSVVLLLIWVFFTLLYCDPSWKNLAEGNLILFLVILVIIVIGILVYVKKSRQGELP